MYPGIHARTRGDKIAYLMADSGESFSYAELESASNQAAHLFRHLGLKPRDGIAILLDNHPLFLQICWGAQRSGLYFTPINTLFQSSEIEYIINNSDARILITSRHFLEKVSLEKLKLEKLSPEKLSPNKTGPEKTHLDKPGVDYVLLVDQPAAEAIAADENNLKSEYLFWTEETRQQPSTPIADEMEGAEMIYSSGTTGVPKGVRFPLNGDPPGTVSALLKTRIKMHQLDEDAIYLSTAPLYHSAPLRYNMMVTRLGGTCVVMPKFDAKTALELIERYAITHSQWVPTMFNRLLKLNDEIRCAYDLSSLRFAIHAAAPCPVNIKERMLDWWGPVLYEYYSGTEANGSTAISPEEWLTHKGSVGKAIHGEIHILDDAGKEMSPGQTGTVYFAKGSDFNYYKDSEKTAKAKNALGWSTLGDMGYVDEENYLYLTDRKSFMIVSGGVNIYPQEVENLLTGHPLVADVAVFGVPNDEFGEEVKAVIELVNVASADDELETELISWCRDRISHLKCPRSIEFIAQLPRHPTGKLFKKKLRDQYWQSHDSKLV